MVGVSGKGFREGATHEQIQLVPRYEGAYVSNDPEWSVPNYVDTLKLE